MARYHRPVGEPMTCELDQEEWPCTEVRLHPSSRYDERWERLPIWAREQMADLHRQLVESEATVRRLEAANAGDSSYPITARYGVGREDKKIHLPEDTFELRFEKNGFEVGIKPSERAGGGRMGAIPDGLEIMCHSWHGVSIRPEASNVLTIFPGRTK